MIHSPAKATKVGILYSQDVYAFVPDPILPQRSVGHIIDDLHRKISSHGRNAVLIEEDRIETISASQFSVFYLFPLLGYVEKNHRIIDALKILEKKRLLFNSLDALVLSASKFSTAEVLATKGVSSPDTLVTENKYEVLKFVEKNQLAIVKPDIGGESMGVTVLRWDSATQSALVHSRGRSPRSVVFSESGESLGSRIPYSIRGDRIALNSPFFVQEYVDTTSILKVYVIDNNPFCGLTISKDHVASAEDSIISHNDIGNGAQQQLLSRETLPTEAASLACAATMAFGLRTGLVDLIYCKRRGMWLALEVNNDDFCKIRDRSERLDHQYVDHGPFDWNSALAAALART